MKSTFRLFAVAVLLAGSTIAAQAQRAVPVSVFRLRPSLSSPQSVTYGTPKATVLRVLGAPTKTTRFYYEIDRVWATVLHYGPNELYFVAGRLESMALHDGRWLVGQPGFRVGSAIGKASPGAPLAFGSFEVEHKAGKSRNLPYSAISYGNFQLPKGGVSDDGYEIMYDAQGRVTHIFAN